MLNVYAVDGKVKLEDVLEVAKSLGGFEALSDTGDGHCCFGGSWYNEETKFWYDLTITFEGEVYEKFSYGDEPNVENDYKGLTVEDVITLADKFDNGYSKYLTIYNGEIYQHLISSDVANDKGECVPYIEVDGKIILV